VRYSYDDGGHLSRVLGPGGTVRTYTYSDRDEMLTADEPGWRIVNEYDAASRVIRQVTRVTGSDATGVISFDYTVRDGSVVQTDITEYDGTHTRQTYNRHHYLLSETLDTDGSSPVSVSYDRDDTTNRTTAIRLRCHGPGQPVAVTLAIPPAFEQDSVKAAIANLCR
jgi:YD repeat-containing protein